LSFEALAKEDNLQKHGIRAWKREKNDDRPLMHTSLNFLQVFQKLFF